MSQPSIRERIVASLRAAKGNPVPIDTLVTTCLDGRPCSRDPYIARATIRSIVSKLRRRSAANSFPHEAGGYAMRPMRRAAQ